MYEEMTGYDTDKKKNISIINILILVAVSLNSIM